MIYQPLLDTQAQDSSQMTDTAQAHCIYQTHSLSSGRCQCPAEIRTHSADPSNCQVVRVTTKQEPISESYSIHGGTLEEVKSVKYFGLNVDSKLNFNTHVMFMLMLRRPTQLLLFLGATCTTAAEKSKRLPLRPMWDPSLNTHLLFRIRILNATSRKLSTPIVVVVSLSMEFKTAKQM